MSEEGCTSQGLNKYKHIDDDSTTYACCTEETTTEVDLSNTVEDNWKRNEFQNSGADAKESTEEPKEPKTIKFFNLRL